jgi:hypothetical protein
VGYEDVVPSRADGLVNRYCSLSVSPNTNTYMDFLNK